MFLKKYFISFFCLLEECNSCVKSFCKNVGTVSSILVIILVFLKSHMKVYMCHMEESLQDALVNLKSKTLQKVVNK